MILLLFGQYLKNWVTFLYHLQVTLSPRPFSFVLCCSNLLNNIRNPPSLGSESRVQRKNCLLLDSNRGSEVQEATALPTIYASSAIPLMVNFYLMKKYESAVD